MLLWTVILCVVIRDTDACPYHVNVKSTVDELKSHELSFLELRLFERVPLRAPDFIREPTMSEFRLAPDTSRDQLVIPRHLLSSSTMSEFRLAPDPSRDMLVIPRHLPSSSTMSEFRLAPDASRDQLFIPCHLPSSSKVTRTPTMMELFLGKGNSSDQSPIPSSQELASSQDILMSQERAFNGKLAVKRSCKAAEWEFIIKGVGQYFYGGRDETRLVVEKYNHFFGRKVRVIKRNPERYTVECFYKEQFTCDWMFHAAPKISNMKGHLFLKTYNGEHTCCAGYSDGTKVDPVTRELVKSLIFDQIEQTPNKKVRGQFKSLFLAFDACISGFEYYRLVLFLDATFLTGKFRGCLMAATRKNANNGILPLAYGIVSSETIDNCHWFLVKLKSILGPRHLKNNVRGKTNKKKGEHGAAMDLFKQCFYSSTHEGFHQGMQKLKDMGCDGLHKFLSDLPLECWSNAHCMGSCYGDMCSNIAESFNFWIREAKGMPIATLVNWIRLKIMDQMTKRKLKGATYKGFICPSLEKKVMASIRVGVQWRITKSGDMDWEVFDGKHTHVNIANFHCRCRVWFTEQFPCDHAISCMHSSKINVYEYINPFFIISRFRASYDRPIKPITDYDKPIDVATGNLVKSPTVL
ncbi:hypothetical protein C5167_044661 [Papaver somniferum]|uniref:SWIM-type domain-containing protein n=1 Tax=Papaver somniferum TaxID=3469 RepID=A0A4Y7LAQ7_PAPSO|nr:hypothetical protein C5167_044661 [Papaver somniferum]